MCYVNLNLGSELTGSYGQETQPEHGECMDCVGCTGGSLITTFVFNLRPRGISVQDTSNIE